MVRDSKSWKARIYGIVSDNYPYPDSKRDYVDIPNSALHVDDAASAFILLVEEALKPNGGNAQWGNDGYYFAEAGEFVCCTYKIYDNAHH